MRGAGHGARFLARVSPRGRGPADCRGVLEEHGSEGAWKGTNPIPLRRGILGRLGCMLEPFWAPWRSFPPSRGPPRPVSAALWPFVSPAKGFTVERFRRLVTTQNFGKKLLPSMHQAIFGPPEVSLHVHNWFTSDDQWHRNLSKEVDRWQDLGVDVTTQVQLVAFASTFNGQSVMDALRACPAAADLPIRADRPFALQREAVKEFVFNIMRSGGVPFSLRFRARVHNACLKGLTHKSRKVVDTEMKKLLSRDDADSLPLLKTYTAKLGYLSRLKGYADDPDRSFLGKNLANTLSAFGADKARFSEHVIAAKEGHPDGPGAEAFYDIFRGEMTNPECRAHLLRAVRRMWPTEVRVGGKGVELHIGVDPSWT